MAIGFGSALEQNMFGADLGSSLSGILSSPAAKNTVVVPIPVQAQAETSSKTATKTKTKQSASKPQAQPIQMQMPNFGPTPTYQQDTVPPVGEQPVWHEELGRYLKGQPLADAMAPPQYQGFGMPVFSSAQAFAMTPDQYNQVLDTTKNNIAFNNKVAGDNYNNTLNIIRTLQQADVAEQEQYSRSLSNRSNIAQTNQTQKETAFKQSPQEEATMRLRGSEAQTRFQSQLQEQLEVKMADVHHRYRLAEIAANKAGDRANAIKGFQLDAMKTVTDIMKDTYLSAVKGMQPSDLIAYQEAVTKGDNSALTALLQNIEIKDPVSAANLRAGIHAEKYLSQVSGLPMGSILAGSQVKQETTKVPTITSKEELKRYLKK